MYEQLTEVLAYLQSAARYKWLALVCAWILSVAGWIFVSQMPDQFKAEARMLIDTRTVLQPLLKGMTIEPDIAEKGRLMAKLMFTRPNLEKIANAVDLYAGATDEKTKDQRRIRLLDSLSIVGERTEERGGNNFFTISAVDVDPKKAAKIVQTALTIFVEQSLGKSREDSVTAAKFLEQQIKDYEVRLKTAEQAREDFKRDNFLLLPEQGNDLYTRLNTLAGQLDETKMAVQEAIKRRDEIKKNLESEKPMFIDSAMEKRIQALQSRLDELLLRYTKEHPEVIAVKKSIADLEKQKKTQEERSLLTEGEGAAGEKGRANLVFQQMKIALGEAEANVASITSRANAYKEKIDTLKQQMDARLKVETQLQGLNRDYEAIKGNYEALLRSRETARLSENVGQNPDTPQFHVVDPPQVPTKPFAPKRILLLAGVFLGSVATGVGLTVLLSLVRPTFSSMRNIREIAGLPVLGSVSMNWIPEVRSRKRREMVRFTALFASLFAAFIGVVVLELQGFNLRQFNF
jgi:polysaccharide chain length determinant protein (PEP-CTERM system associated)